MDKIIKAPLHNLEIEQAFLGNIITLNQRTNLAISDFYNFNHQKIYQAIKDLWKNDQGIDIISLVNRLKEKNQLEEVGGCSYLAQLSNKAGLSSNTKGYTETIRKKARLRELNKLGYQIIELSENESKPIEIIINEAGQKINKITDKHLSGKKNLFKIISGSEMIDKKIKAQPYIVDKMIPERAITAITADSGKGKSMFALIIAYHIAKGEKIFGEFEVKQNKVLIIDQEMDSDIIHERYKSVFKEEKESQIDFIYEQSLQIDDNNHYQDLIRLIKQNNYKVIIFDTLTNLHNKSENSADEMKEVNRRLLDLINQTGVSIIYLHHHKKRQQGELYSQSSSRGSTEIIAKVASHLLIDSKVSIDAECDISITELTIQQEKARRPERINKIGLKIFYDQNLKQTHWEYIGEVKNNEKKIEQAKDFIKEELRNNSWLSIENLKNSASEKKIDIGEKNLREACRELVKNMEIQEKTGKELNREQARAKFYNLI